MWRDIEKAAKSQRIVYIRYRKMSTGEVRGYKIEPYSRRGDYLYGYDISDRHIKKFYIPNILSVRITTEKFIPRWTIEI